MPDPGARGALFRARRVSLGLGREAAARLLGGRVRDPSKVLFAVEAGKAEPPGGWEALESRLFAELEVVVCRLLRDGGDWRDIRLPGWGADDIRTASWACSGGGM